MLGLRKSSSRVSTRRQIAIKGVKNGVLLLPGNNYRLVLSISSVNFELKSEAEQDALIDTYQSFLNSLGCNIQILVRIREMDMDKYIAEFNTRIKQEKQKLYKDQLKNYTRFVKSLINANKILSRQFYVVIPNVTRDNDFETVQEALNLNADIVAKGLSRIGMQSRTLTSLEILDLFYSLYNPGQAKRQPITEQTMDLLSRSYL